MKIGILTKESITLFNYRVINSIIEDQRFTISHAIIDSRLPLSWRQKLSKNLKRGRGGYIVIMFIKRLFQKHVHHIDMSNFCARNNIKIIRTKSPYSEETLNQLRTIDLDILLLINGFGIIKEGLLKIPPKGILSYHHGDLRKYRGMPPAFWELYNNEKEMGITVQLISKGLDQGIPVIEKKISIKKNDSLKSLTTRAYNESADLMHQALIILTDSTFQPVELDSLGKLYTLPNFRKWFILQCKVLLRKISLY